MAIDCEITAFVRLLDNYVTVVEVINVLQDSSEFHREIFLRHVGSHYDYNVFLVLTKSLVRDHIVWDYIGVDEKFWLTSHAVPWWRNIQCV